MRRTAPWSASLLLQHLHRSLPALQQLYRPSSLSVSSTSSPSPSADDRGRACPVEAASSTSTKATVPPRSSHGLHTPAASASAPFPLDPATEEDGDRVLQFFCDELGMGATSLRRWRRSLTRMTQRRWGVPTGEVQPSPSVLFGESGEAAASAPLVEGRLAAQAVPRVPWIHVGGGATAVNGSPSPSSRWLRPRAQDVAAVQSAVRDLKLLVSPFLTLSPPPYVGSSPPSPRVADGVPDAASSFESPRPRTYAECSRWIATQRIPAGMFLLSIPTEAVLFANPPPTSDPVLRFFMEVEELVAQLVSAAEETEASHHGYVRYLCDSVVPCRNLPFWSVDAVQQLFSSTKEIAPTPAAVPPAALVGAASVSPVRHHRDPGAAAGTGLLYDARQSITLTADSQEVGAGATARDGGEDGDMAGEAAEDSPALSLTRFFHQDMAGEPLSAYLRARLSAPEYAWWVSLVLSHRAGSTSLLPMVDKLNHSPFPNSYFTMATAETFCGLDVFDNLLAGVPGPLLCQPYVHVFAMRDVAPGAEVTLCYASASDGAYRAAGQHPPPPPPPPSTLSTTGGTKSRRDDVRGPPRWHGKRTSSTSHGSAESIEDVMHRLFPAIPPATLHDTGEDIGDSVGAAAAAAASELQQLQHSGRQEVHTAEGAAAWTLQWGFVPPCDAVYSAQDLREMAALIAEHRVDTRALLFPPLTSDRDDSRDMEGDEERTWH